MGYVCVICIGSSSILSNYKDDDIAPELAKLDEMMSSIAKEMEDDNSLAASVVTAFLKKEHTLVQQNAGGYPSIIQVCPLLPVSYYNLFYSLIRKCSKTSNKLYISHDIKED